MPMVPAPSEETVCEINRDFFTLKLDAQDADTRAQERYSKILNRVFPKVPFKVCSIPIAEDNVAGDALGSTGGGSVLDTDGLQGDDQDVARAVPVQETLDEALGEPPSLFQKLDSLKDFLLKSFSIGEEPGRTKLRSLQSISWHKHKLYLAFVANTEHVLVVDYEEAEVRNPHMLSHDTQQRNVEAVEWRPNSGSMIAVACKGGVCLWMASYPGGVAPVRSGAVPMLGSPTRAGTRWTLVDFLRCGNDVPVSALSWSPCGRLLACGSRDNATFTVWDVSLGESTPLRRGLAGIDLLKWSPSGDYLLSAKVDASFQLWETSTWTSEPWSSAGGAIVSAAWSPDGRMLLCAFDQSTTLGSLHFAGKPPSLEVHLLPLELPEIDGITDSAGSIERMAWDGTGERLAVSFRGGDAVYAGLIAVYDTRRTPIISASLLGFVRGPGEGANPLAFGFHDKLRQGALLGVCWSTGVVCVYPLLFRTH